MTYGIPGLYGLSKARCGRVFLPWLDCPGSFGFLEELARRRHGEDRGNAARAMPRVEPIIEAALQCNWSVVVSTASGSCVIRKFGWWYRWCDEERNDDINSEGEFRSVSKL